MDTEERELMRTVVERLAGLPDQLRQAVTDRLWSEVPTYLEEKAFQLAGATALTWQAVEENPILVQYVTGWSSTAGVPQSTGTLQLGDWQIPVGPGAFSLRPYKILERSAVRQLVVPAANAGALSILVAGIPLPSLVPVMRR